MSFFTTIGVIVVGMVIYAIIKFHTEETPQRRAEKLLDNAFENFRKGNYYNCIQLCDESLNYYQDWRAYQLKAASYYDMGEFSKSFHSVKTSLRLEPDISKNLMSYTVLESLKVLSDIGAI